VISLHPSEADVVQVARSILGLLPGRAAVDLLSTPRERPAMRPEAIEVLEDTLRKGLVRSLVRRGGGRRSRSLDANGGVSEKGRLWERHEAPLLPVTAATAHLLAYLVSSGLGAAKAPRRAPPPLALGDEVFFFLAAERCIEAGFEPALGAYPFSASVLASVAFPVHVGAGPRPAFEALLDGSGAIVVEALEIDLASKIALAERSRRTLASSAGVARATAAIRDRTVAFVRAAIEAGRPDLGLFVLRGIDSLLVAPRGTEPAAWMPRAAEPLPLSARQEMARSGLVWFEVVDAYRAVQKRARSVGFVDDDFERAQHILTMLEAVPALSPARAAQLDSLVRALSGLEVGPSDWPSRDR
jgi:hypothetical protein